MSTPPTPPKTPEKPIRTLSDGVANPKRGSGRPAGRPQSPDAHPSKDSDA